MKLIQEKSMNIAYQIPNSSMVFFVSIVFYFKAKKERITNKMAVISVSMIYYC